MMMMVVMMMLLCEGYVQYSVSTVDTHHTDTPPLPSQYIVNMHNSILTDTDRGTEPVTEPVSVAVLDVNGSTVAKHTGASSMLVISDVHLWWPYTMNDHRAPYLYMLQVTSCYS